MFSQPSLISFIIRSSPKRLKNVNSAQRDDESLLETEERMISKSRSPSMDSVYAHKKKRKNSSNVKRKKLPKSKRLEKLHRSKERYKKLSKHKRRKLRKRHKKLERNPLNTVEVDGDVYKILDISLLSY